MATLTPLHEQFCTLKTNPPNLNDVLEGLSMLATDSAVEVTDLVKSIHQEIMLRPLGLNNDRGIALWENGLTHAIYRLLQNTMQKIGNFIAGGLKAIKDLEPQQLRLPPYLHHLVSALNGVLGDHLINTHNPIALPMMLYTDTGMPQREELSGDIIIYIHGLCMDQYSWRFNKSVNMGKAVKDIIPEATNLYLSYNTGRRISANGHTLMYLLEALIEKNPKITTIRLVGHSMGGLLSRSALFYGKQHNYKWVKKVKALICLGSPHQGSILERGAFIVLEAVGKIPFAGALARIGDIRSAGVLDLRYGSVRNDDWEHLKSRLGQQHDNRKPAPLPTNIETYLVAGSLYRPVKLGYLIPYTFSDGLVSIGSALGETGSHSFGLDVPASRKKIFYKTGHMKLQYDPAVIEHVCDCMAISFATQRAKESNTLVEIDAFIDDATVTEIASHSAETSNTDQKDNHAQSVIDMA